ncbi:hypothetical protein Tsubulata_011722 [Turnera subulata]|uniref:BolA protein n=1 Tax=Turnera subulata TaxID=218843 RepID=A0A9Q0GHD7_9ROSI|nr:hypothetical protein Tsubulata_011722 [Turnera subulata]
MGNTTTLVSRPYALFRQAALPSPSSVTRRRQVVSLPTFCLADKASTSSSSSSSSSSSTTTTTLPKKLSLWCSISSTSIAGCLNLSRQGFSHVGSRKFTTGASHVNDAGSIQSPLMQSMERKIKEELDADSVSVKDAYGDGRHVSIDVISSAFEGKSAVDRQRMVYKAIWEELQNIVHAVDQMVTRTPAEAADKI